MKIQVNLIISENGNKFPAVYNETSELGYLRKHEQNPYNAYIYKKLTGPINT